MSNQNNGLNTTGGVWPSLQDFFRRSPVPMKILDPDNHILEANPAIVDFLGYPREKLLEKEELDLIHPVDLFAFRQHFHEILALETSFSRVRARQRHADGHWIPTLIHHLWLTHPGTSPRLVLELVVDLSGESALEEASAYLESKHLFGQMARGLAHDFNNLLTIILMKLTLLEQTSSEDGAVLEAVDKTKDVVDRMRRLSSELAQFGEQRLESAEQTAVNDAINEMRPFFNYVHAGPATLELQLADRLPDAQISRVQLEQLLLNLVVNASDAIIAAERPGTITIQTVCTQLDQIDAINLDLRPGDYVQINVRDDGIGMDEKTLERVFEPYFSTKGSLGTGVGLPFVRTMLQNLGGYIALETRPDHGSLAQCYIPAARGCGEVASAEED